MIGKKTKTLRIKVYGIVQGVGFRPTVARHAATAGVTGSVCNKGPYVEIFAQGTDEQTQFFVSLLEKRPPRRAAVLKMDVRSADSSERRFESFEIIESAKTKGEIFISPDIAICEECKAELYDPADRRYLHPFINCTCCGPRLTILDALPYDRERTSMKMFPMCPQCAEEYHSPSSRRYDAQPVCCNECGPEVYLAGEEAVRGREAITRTRRIIAEGGIAAIKGIGGFHLCCDATNEEAVAKLRTRKSRPVKPFAVMMRDEAAVERECIVSERQREILTGHQKPILLLEKKPQGRLCPSIAPGNPTVGVMLPYAPVQLLIFDYTDGIEMPDCLVMTSGNVSGAPICRDDAEALQELGNLCDCILSHDRKIRIRADDSVMDFYDDEPYMIRRSRGYAPLPYMLSAWGENMGEGHGTGILAIGGELKNTFCIAKDQLFYPSPYIGDMADLRSVDALKEAVRRMGDLLEVKPDVIVCDKHPLYHSSEVAKELGEEMGVPVLEIQHHYAHTLSCMAENDHLDPVIGVSFDGTGYGTEVVDGAEVPSIWGGEFLLCDVHEFERAGSIEVFPQAGGDASSKEGWRIAVSLLKQALDEGEAFPDSLPAPTLEDLARSLGLCDPTQLSFLEAQIEGNINCVPSTSAGRVFDAASAILGFRRESTCEGEASMVLEFAAERYTKRFPDGTPLDAPTFLFGADPGDDSLFRLPTAVFLLDLALRRMDGESPDKLAYEFHLFLADLIVSGCILCRERSGRNTVALSGGVFQNLLLTDLVVNSLEENDFQVLTHSLSAPNDGGIGLGQALYGMFNK